MISERSITVTTPTDCRAVFVFKEGKHLRGRGDYIRLFQDITLKMAQDRELNLTDHRVVWAILNRLQFENRIEATHTEIAELMGVDRANVSRSIHKLEERGFISLLETKGKRKIYCLNPYIAFKTKAKNLHDLEEEWGELTGGEVEAC